MKFQRLLICLFLLPAAFCAAQTKVELGEINHAKFRIDVPENWNHSLVLYLHGYSPDPGAYNDKDLQKVLAVFSKEGYALAQSGYSTGGWAIEQAIPETEALRKYFIQKYGKPKETWVTGHSMGGFLTMEMMEKFPEVYDGALALCGPLGSPSWFIKRYAFDLRVVFDYYFPGALPSPANVPADYKMTDDLRKNILQLLESKPHETEVLRNLTGAHNNRDLGNGFIFATYVLMDLQQRSHGNPFDNRDTIYTGTPEDNALNDGVHRYAADPGTAAYLEKNYTPTGHIIHPMLAIHTTYDPTVAPAVPDMYNLLTRQAGTDKLFVQQYVKHDGHCNISPEETEYGFNELRQWKEKGQRPTPGGLTVTSTAAQAPQAPSGGK